MSKSETDIHWNDRARAEPSDERVNISDLVQRSLENDFILSVLPRARVLEVGCGNGHLTSVLREHAEFVDAFDYAENMIERARRYVGERNNRFFHDSVLAPTGAKGPYDAIVCVRVLINLRGLAEQQKAVENLAGLVRPGGTLVLVEGYRDGFDALNTLRESVGLPAAQPAKINYYSYLRELQPTLERFFEVGRTCHTGMFDFLTRVVNPLLNGVEAASGPSAFHERILPLARACNPNDFAPLARLHGMELRRR